MPAAADRGPVGWDRRIDGALTGVVELCGASSGCLYLLPADEEVLHLAVVRGLPAEFVAPWTRVAVTAPVPVADAVRLRSLVWAGSQQDFAREYPRSAVTMPYHFALAAAPVEADGRCVGALLLLWPSAHPQYLGEAERAVVTAGCARLGELLAEAAPAVPVRPRVLPLRLAAAKLPETPARGFAERLPGGSCGMDLNGRIVFLTDSACALLGAGPEKLLGALPWQALPWLDDPSYEDRYRAAIISREPAAFTALRPPDRWLAFRLYPSGDGISVRITPADHGPEPVPPSRPVPVSRAGQIYQIMHLAAALTEAVSVDDVVSLVAEQVLPSFGADGLALLTAEHGRLLVTGYRGYTDDAMARFEDIPLKVRDTPTVRALTTGIPGFYGSSAELAEAYPDVPQVTGKQAWAVLPLITSGRPVGCLLLSYDRPHPFAADERTVLTSLAGLIAQALDRAHLYDTKNQLAHDLQQALLPHTLPTVHGLRVAAHYLPTTRGMDVGGDFYDLIRLGPQAAAAVIGDVQGHSFPAAALMGQVRTAVHAAAGASPEEVLVRTNRLLCDLDPGLFTTCLYAHLDLAAGRAYLVSAGHPPPVLRPPGGPSRVLDIPPGPPMGIDPDAVYPITEAPFEPGALLLLYTDGLVEAPGTDLGRAIAALAGQLDRSLSGDLDVTVRELVARSRRAGRRWDDIATLLLQAGPL
ncbi:SpoIIE family protein phosphatase [Streptomyces sp. NRRL B-24484]|uniref:SpoIIE family protein phosphatase n=1 Tax=Streptomyces sp. NRRL B-24484 TaxID=1463833 RepID=UPI0004C08965|nr:SpoIIE family protein phosphatase [Streptomyces sp. NRRL B-24484]